MHDMHMAYRAKSNGSSIGSIICQKSVFQYYQNTLHLSAVNCSIVNHRQILLFTGILGQ